MDHCFDSRACLFVFGQQLGAFADQRFLALPQRAVFLAQPLAQLGESLDLGGQVAELLQGIVGFAHAQATISAVLLAVNMSIRRGLVTGIDRLGRRGARFGCAANCE